MSNIQNKKYFYVQKSIFLNETNQFLDQIENQLQLQQSQKQNDLNQQNQSPVKTLNSPSSPSKFTPKELDISKIGQSQNQKQETLLNLEENNKQMVQKMRSLIQLTQKVVNKMNNQKSAERNGSIGGSSSTIQINQDYKIDEEAERIDTEQQRNQFDQSLQIKIQDIEKQIEKEYAQVKKFLQEKQDLNQIFDSMQDQYKKIQHLQDQNKEIDREKKELLTVLQTLTQRAEGSESIIHKVNIDSGKFQKIEMLQRYIIETKDQSKQQEKYCRLWEQASKKVFDDFNKANEEQKILKKELQILKQFSQNGWDENPFLINKQFVNQDKNAGRFLSDSKIQKQQKNKEIDPNEQALNLINHLKKKHQEIQIKDRAHQQKWEENEIKKQELDKKIEILQGKINIVETENNAIWNEINDWRKKIPNYDFEGLCLTERQSYFVEGVFQALDPGKHTPIKNLIAKKKYKGPLIKPLVPNFVADQINYLENIDDQNQLSNMDYIKKHYEMLKRKANNYSSPFPLESSKMPKTTKASLRTKLRPIMRKQNSPTPSAYSIDENQILKLQKEIFSNVKSDYMGKFQQKGYFQERQRSFDLQQVYNKQKQNGQNMIIQPQADVNLKQLIQGRQTESDQSIRSDSNQQNLRLSTGEAINQQKFQKSSNLQFQKSIENFDDDYNKNKQIFSNKQQQIVNKDLSQKNKIQNQLSDRKFSSAQFSISPEKLQNLNENDQIKNSENFIKKQVRQKQLQKLMQYYSELEKNKDNNETYQLNENDVLKAIKILNEEESIESQNQEVENDMDEGDFGDYINADSSMLQTQSPKIGQKKKAAEGKSKDNGYQVKQAKTSNPNLKNRNEDIQLKVQEYQKENDNIIDSRLGTAIIGIEHGLKKIPIQSFSSNEDF